MNQRDALRFAANELLEAARAQAEAFAAWGQGGRSAFGELSARDVERIVRGFEILAARLEYTVTGHRAKSADPGDPDQIPLFEEED